MALLTTIAVWLGAAAVAAIVAFFHARKVAERLAQNTLREDSTSAQNRGRWTRRFYLPYASAGTDLGLTQSPYLPVILGASTGAVLAFYICVAGGYGWVGQAMYFAAAVLGWLLASIATDRMYRLRLQELRLLPNATGTKRARGLSRIYIGCCVAFVLLVGSSLLFDYVRVSPDSGLRTRQSPHPREASPTTAVKTTTTRPVAAGTTTIAPTVAPATTMSAPTVAPSTQTPINTPSPTTRMDQWGSVALGKDLKSNFGKDKYKPRSSYYESAAKKEEQLQANERNLPTQRLDNSDGEAVAPGEKLPQARPVEPAKALPQLMLGKWQHSGAIYQYRPDGTFFRYGSDETNSKTGFDSETGETRATRWHIEGTRLVQDQLSPRRTQQGMEFLLLPRAFKAEILLLTESQLVIRTGDSGEEMRYQRIGPVSSATISASIAPLTQDEIFPGETYPKTRKDYLAEAELNQWSIEQLRHAINEMFARHGADFPKTDVKVRFALLSWYKPRPGVDFDVIESEFSEVEKANLKLLAAARDAKTPKSVATAQQTRTTLSTGTILIDVREGTVGGVRMGDTGSALLANLGPERVTKTTELLEGDPHDLYVVSFGGKKAYRHWGWFSVDDPAFRTAEGMGVGNTVAEFERVYGTAEESNEEGYKVFFGGENGPPLSVEATGRGHYKTFKVSRINVIVSDSTESTASSPSPPGNVDAANARIRELENEVAALKQREFAAGGTAQSRATPQPMTALATKPITAEQLYAAYESNKVVAHEQYGGRQLVVTGPVYNVGENSNPSGAGWIDGPWANLSAARIGNAIECHFDAADRDRVIRLPKGATVTLTGKVTGTHPLRMTRCRLQ